jgi:hypothetical protein
MGASLLQQGDHLALRCRDADVDAGVESDHERSS